MVDCYNKKLSLLKSLNIKPVFSGKKSTVTGTTRALKQSTSVDMRAKMGLTIHPDCNMGDATDYDTQKRDLSLTYN